MAFPGILKASGHATVTMFYRQTPIERSLHAQATMSHLTFLQRWSDSVKQHLHVKEKSLIFFASVDCSLEKKQLFAARYNGTPATT